MNRSISLIAAAVLGFGAFAGCSGGTTPASPGAESSASPTETQAAAAPHMELVLAVESSPFYQSMKCGAADAAKELGVELNVSAPQNWGAADQLPFIDAVASKNPDALIVVPTDPDGLTPSLKRIQQQGAVIVEVDQRISDESVSVSRIGTDDLAGGAQAAQAMAKLIGEKGKVMTITAPPGVDQQYTRAQGFEQEIATFPNITYLGDQHSKSDVNLAASHVTAQLASDPDLAGIFVTNDLNAMGVIAGVKEAGKVGQVTVVAYDAADTQIEALREGTLHALIAQDPYVEGYLAVETALNALNDKPVERVQYIDMAVLTADDTQALDDYIVRNGGSGNCGA